MDALELRVLLEAAARELNSVASQLPNDDWDEAVLNVHDEITEARVAVEEVAAACDCALTFGTAGQETSKVLYEARSLSAEATRARDLAEARLWAFQDEHAELLERLRELSLQQQERLDEQRLETDLAASKEAGLVERCAQLDNDVRALRKDVDAKSQRLIASSSLGHSLELNKRKLRRQHEGSLVENAVAREILDLQQSTEAHLQRVSGKCGEVDQSLELAQKRCAEKMEGLQSEWSEQRAKYEANMTSFQKWHLDLQQEYDDRWRSTAKSAKQVMETRTQHTTKSKLMVEQEIFTLDEEWEREAIASREVAEDQDRMMSDARQAALCEMEAELHARQHDMEDQVASVRRQCEAARDRQLQKTADFQQEVLRYRKKIGELNSGYRSKTQRATPTCSTPRGRQTPILTASSGPFTACD